MRPIKRETPIEVNCRRPRIDAVSMAVGLRAFARTASYGAGVTASTGLFFMRPVLSRFNQC